MVGSYSLTINHGPFLDYCDEILCLQVEYHIQCKWPLFLMKINIEEAKSIIIFEFVCKLEFIMIKIKM